MTTVGAIDIGNTTTEVVLAEVTARDVTPLGVRRGWTRGVKGGAESIAAAARLMLLTENAAGTRADLLLLPPLRPVLTIAATLPSPRDRAAALRRLDGPSASTPAGRGFAVGTNLPLSELSGPSAPSGPVVVSVPTGSDFEGAAARIAEAQHAGSSIVGVVAAGDDAVLIANRIPQGVPIVDEADLTCLRTGDLVAVEVAEAGSRVQVLSDPVALVAAFKLTPEQATGLAGLALDLADARSAAVALARLPMAEAPDGDAGWLEYDAEGGRTRIPLTRHLAKHASSLRPGAVRRLDIPAGTQLSDTLAHAGDRVRDVFAVDLPAVREHSLPRRGTIELSDLPIAALVEPAPSESLPDAALAAATGRPVRVTASEAEAAALGALTTPGATPDAAVCDMGGGTIDLVWGDERLTAAGGGELLTLSVAKALGLGRATAEHVKRSASFRVEAPHVVHYEDGGRGFTEREMPADTLGRLCHMHAGTPVPFSDQLAPEEWRSLRLAMKQRVIGANVDRCLSWMKGTPSVLLLCGGAALDAESGRIVSESVRARGITVGRANVGGRYGPRYGAAVGLLYAYQSAENRSQ